MRIVIAVVVALLSLGAAAFGVVTVQKSGGPATLASALAAPPRAAGVTPVATPAITEVAAAPARPVANPVADATVAPVGAAAPAPAPAPVIAPAAVASAAVATPPAAAEPTPAEPIRLAQTSSSTTSNTAVPAAGPSLAAANSGAPKIPASSIPPCDKPGGMGLARIVEIDTTGGPGFGFEHFKQYDFLRDKEVVLTFDDGPWPGNTPAVLKALADQCLKATFFEIGEHATWHPEITKMVLEAGHTVGSHTWSHKDLARGVYAKDIEQAKDEIELGVSAVQMAAGTTPTSSFFRFPALQHPPELLSYLAERNIAIMSTDIDSRDFKLHKPELVIKSVMTQLDKRGKGIILMHDFQKNTAEAMPELLRRLKAGGYKVVHMVSRQPVKTLPKYDEELAQKDKLSSNNTRPEASVVRTIGE
jgi:peptidoglycan/xylan/chitin deacetylase (PgdA/CDA1 family)